MQDELAPPGGAAHANPVTREKTAIEAPLLVVKRSLLGGQLDRNAFDVVVGEVIARKLDDVLAVHDGADERGEIDLAAVAAFGGRRQAEPIGSDARARGEGERAARQVVAFVEDNR